MLQPRLRAFQLPTSRGRSSLMGRIVALISLLAIFGFWTVPASASTVGQDLGFDHQVVVIGTGGVRWADMDQTPAIQKFASVSAIGSLVVRNVRSSTCPADGWLAFSAGRRAGALCGERLRPCTLELGGKSAAIVLDDADIAAVVPQLMDAGIMNNGQACVAQTRVLASRQRYD